MGPALARCPCSAVPAAHSVPAPPEGRGGCWASLGLFGTRRAPEKGLVDTPPLNEHHTHWCWPETRVSGRGPCEAWTPEMSENRTSCFQDEAGLGSGSTLQLCDFRLWAPDAVEVTMRGYLSKCREVRTSVRTAGKSISPSGKDLEGKLFSKKCGTLKLSETLETGSFEPPASQRMGCLAQKVWGLHERVRANAGPSYLGSTSRPVHCAGSGQVDVRTPTLFRE